MTARRTTFLIAATILVVAIVFAIPPLINVDRYRPRVIAYVQQKIGKKVEIEQLALSLFPLSLQVHGLGVKNPAMFPGGYVVHVARIDAALDAAALLNRQVVIKSLVLDSPVIHLISDPDGPWNFENPQATTSQKALPLEPIAKVQIQRGEVIASNLLPSDAPGPILFEAHDISGELADVNLEAIINPSSSSVDGVGELKVGRLRFASVQAANLYSKVRLESRQVVLSDISAQLYGGAFKGEFVFKLSGKAPSFASKAQVHGIEMAHLLAAFGNGPGIMTGKMDGDLTLMGEIAHSSRPLAAMRGVGHVAVRNGEAPSLALNANLMRLMHFNDLGPAKNNPSSFNLISTDLQLADLRISSSKIDVDGYGVDIDGSGAVSVSGSDALDYRGVAQITTPQGFFTNVFGRLSGGKMVDGKLTFPFRISGTIQSPVFSKAEGVK